MNTTFSLAFAFALVVMIVLPVLLALVVARTRRVPFRVVLVAAGFYLLNLAVNVPLTGFVWPLLLGRSSLLTLLLTCLTWGVCEELARYASFRFVRVMKENRTDSGALAAGLGHGGAESVLFGLQFAAGTVLVLLFPHQFPAGARAQIFANGPTGFILTGLDRIPALACQLAFAVLVVLAFRRGRRYLLLAIAAHTAVDVVVFGIQKYVQGFWFEAVFALLGGCSLVFVALVVRSGVLADDGAATGPQRVDPPPRSRSRSQPDVSPEGPSA